MGETPQGDSMQIPGFGASLARACRGRIARHNTPLHCSSPEPDARFQRFEASLSRRQSRIACASSTASDERGWRQFGEDIASPE